MNKFTVLALCTLLSSHPGFTNAMVKRQVGSAKVPVTTGLPVNLVRPFVSVATLRYTTLSYKTTEKGAGGFTQWVEEGVPLTLNETVTETYLPTPTDFFTTTVSTDKLLKYESEGSYQPITVMDTYKLAAGTYTFKDGNRTVTAITTYSSLIGASTIQPSPTQFSTYTVPPAPAMSGKGMCDELSAAAYPSGDPNVINSPLASDCHLMRNKYDDNPKTWHNEGQNQDTVIVIDTNGTCQFTANRQKGAEAVPWEMNSEDLQIVIDWVIGWQAPNNATDPDLRILANGDLQCAQTGNHKDHVGIEWHIKKTS